MPIAVVGGGPCGILTATLLASKGKSVILFQKGELGGSHRVDWVGQYFTEHGPRVYTSAYVNYIQILRYLNLDFYDYYSKGESNTGMFTAYMTVIRQSPLNLGKS